MKYQFKTYDDGDIEVLSEDLYRTPFEYLGVRCSNPIMRNMTDAELIEDDKKYNGDGREMRFNIFVSHNTCLQFTYDLFGIGVNFTMCPKLEKPNILSVINIVLNTVNDYFKDKYITDISEAFYKKFENEILEKILENTIK